MNHPSRTLIFFLLVSLSLTSCRSYTRNLTRGHEVNPAFLSALFEPGKSYKVKLKNSDVFRIDVISVTQDSLHGEFHFMAGSRMRKGESRVLLDDIAEVKEKKFDIVKTALVIVVPIALGAIIVSTITFPGVTF
jgi:hypothetical protein